MFENVILKGQCLQIFVLALIFVSLDATYVKEVAVLNDAFFNIQWTKHESNKIHAKVQKFRFLKSIVWQNNKLHATTPRNTNRHFLYTILSYNFIV